MVDTVKTPHHGNKVLMNLSKRRRGNSPPPVVSTDGNTTTTLPPLQAVGSSSGYQGHGSMALSNLNNRASSNVVPNKGKDVQHPVKPKRKARRPPLKIPVETQKLNVWTLLQNTNANLSVADVLALDKNACRDTLAGIRHLRQRPSRTTVSSKTPMVVDSSTVDADSWGESEGDSEDNSLYSDGSEYSYDDSADGYTDDEGESVYRYPYSLENMKRGSPLRGMVSINGFELECVFDSGASVSVISKALADKVGLVPNGDTIELTGFDNRAAENPANVVMDVPVLVAGCLRPEHMCVLDLPVHSEASGLCLLDVPWFKAYSIQTVIEAGVIRIPTSRGLVDHGCATTHNKQARGAGGTRKSKRVNFLIQGDGESSSGDGLPGIEDMAKRLKDSEMQVFMVMTAGASLGTKEADLLSEEQVKQKNRDLLESYEEGIHGNLLEEDDGEEVAAVVPMVLENLIEKYADCFVENSGLGRVKGYTHTIELLPESKPVRSVPFRLTWEENDFLQKEIKEMLELGVIRPSKTGAFSSPCFFVKKKDGSRRIVIDYRNLNRMTVPSSHPLPLISELLDSLGGARFFTTMDMASGYWQVPMAEESIEKTGFVTNKGIYEFLVMPFGLCTAPSRFQSMMNETLQEYIGVHCLVFIDDVLIYGGNTIEEHAILVESVLRRCRLHNLRIKKKKCSWGLTEVDYLGHKVTSAGLLPGDHNIKKVLEFKVPNNGSEVKSFLGLCSYYRAFVKDYARMAGPLQNLVKKNVVFEWGPEQEASFRGFQVALTSPPILAYPNRDRVQVLTVDGSGVGIGAILSQVSDMENLHDEEVVSYASRTLRGAEKNYAITHIEALAVVWAVQYYRHSLLGRRFLLVSDHSALKYVFNPTKKTPKLTRWAATLMEYDFQLAYRKGENNPADPLSRLMTVKDNGVDSNVEPSLGD